MYKVILVLILLFGTAYLYGYLSIPRFRRANAERGPLGRNAQVTLSSKEDTESRISDSFERLRSSIAKLEGELPATGATQDQLSEVERKIGYGIPAELRALWKITSGHSLGIGWHLSTLEESCQATSEQLTWSPPETGFPDLLLEGNDNGGWTPGFIVFASRDTDQVGIYLEDGKVYFQRPSEGLVLQANSLDQWLSNFAFRVENDQYGTNAFGRTVLTDEDICTPGAFLNPVAVSSSPKRILRFSLSSFLLTILIAGIGLHYSTSRVSAKRSLAAVNNKSYPHWVEFQDSLLGKLASSVGIGSLLKNPKVDLGWVERVSIPHPLAQKKKTARVEQFIATLLRNDVATSDAISMTWNADIDENVEAFLLKHKKLKVLRIRDEPSVSFLRHLSSFTRLEVLELPWANRNELESVLPKCSSIQWLRLEGCEDQNLKRIRRLLPYTYVNP